MRVGEGGVVRGSPLLACALPSGWKIRRKRSFARCVRALLASARGDHPLGHGDPSVRQLVGLGCVADAGLDLAPGLVVELGQQRLNLSGPASRRVTSIHCSAESYSTVSSSVSIRIDSNPAPSSNPLRRAGSARAQRPGASAGGGGAPSWLATACIGSDAHGLDAASAQVVSATRSPGASTRAVSRNAAAGSAINGYPIRHATASTDPSGTSIASASITRYSTPGTPSAQGARAPLRPSPRRSRCR